MKSNRSFRIIVTLVLIVSLLAALPGCRRDKPEAHDADSSSHDSSEPDESVEAGKTENSSERGENSVPNLPMPILLSEAVRGKMDDPLILLRITPRDGDHITAATRTWTRRFEEILTMPSVIPVDQAILAEEVLYRIELMYGEERDIGRLLVVTESGSVSVSDMLTPDSPPSAYQTANTEDLQSLSASVAAFITDMEAEDARLVRADSVPANPSTASTAIDLTIRNAASTPLAVPRVWVLEREDENGVWQHAADLTLYRPEDTPDVPTGAAIIATLLLPEDFTPEQDIYQLRDTGGTIPPTTVEFSDKGMEVHPPERM